MRRKPRGRAAEKRDELAPVCSIETDLVRCRPGRNAIAFAGTSQQASRKTAALRDFNPAYVACGSFASYPHAGRARGMSALPLIATNSAAPSEASRCATLGLMQRGLTVGGNQGLSRTQVIPVRRLRFAKEP